MRLKYYTIKIQVCFHSNIKCRIIENKEQSTIHVFQFVGSKLMKLYLKSSMPFDNFSLPFRTLPICLIHHAQKSNYNLRTENMKSSYNPLCGHDNTTNH